MIVREVTIGNCRLIQGDCVENIEACGHVDAIVTDPPYGAAYSSNSGGAAGSSPIVNDGVRVSLRLYRRLVPLLPKVATLWFTRWDAWPDVWELFAPHMQIKGLLVWDKGSPGMGDLKHWGCSHEMIASMGPVRTRGARDSSVIRMNTVPSAKRNHPTEKPVDLIQYLIEKITDSDQVVLDPFMGSGTTGVACARSGRGFVGYEIDRGYFETSVRRITEAYKQSELFVSKPAPIPPKQEQLL